MKLSRTALIVALILLSLSAHAATISVPHGLTGAWWDPALDGEGLLLEEMASTSAPNDPHTVSAFWFTYDDQGRPLYLVGAGKYTGGKITMDVVTTSGGRHGSALNPALVSRAPWGSLQISPESCGSLMITYQQAGAASSGNVRFSRFPAALGMTTANATCAMVSETTGTDGPASVVTLGVCPDFGSCYTSSMPYVSTASVSTTYVGTRPPSYALQHLRITPTDGYVDVAYIGTEDSSPASAVLVDGITQGQRIAAGQSVDVYLRTGWTNNVTEQLRFKIAFTYQNFSGSANNLSIDYRAQVRTN